MKVPTPEGGESPRLSEQEAGGSSLHSWQVESGLVAAKKPPQRQNLRLRLPGHRLVAGRRRRRAAARESLREGEEQSRGRGLVQLVGMRGRPLQVDLADHIRRDLVVNAVGRLLHPLGLRRDREVAGSDVLPEEGRHNLVIADEAVGEALHVGEAGDTVERVGLAAFGQGLAAQSFGGSRRAK